MLIILVRNLSCPYSPQERLPVNCCKNNSSTKSGEGCVCQERPHPKAPKQNRSCTNVILCLIQYFPFLLGVCVCVCVYTHACANAHMNLSVCLHVSVVNVHRCPRWLVLGCHHASSLHSSVTWGSVIELGAQAFRLLTGQWAFVQVTDWPMSFLDPQLHPQQGYGCVPHPARLLCSLFTLCEWFCLHVCPRTTYVHA